MSVVTKADFRIRFITSAYGEDYVGFLLTNIYSIRKSNPDANITVIWDDIDEKLVASLEKAFPLINFLRVQLDIGNDFIKRISSKTIYWEIAARKHIGEDLCFVDSDTLVLKDIKQFFNQKFDIAFTYKNEKYPLNTGVLLVKNRNENVCEFFNYWKQITLSIINDSEKFHKANNRNYPYGGADQMAFYNILNYDTNIAEYTLKINADQLIFKGIPCVILNETNSRPISDDHNIIHYKGGWRPILINGTDFTEKRSKKNSFEMYRLFLKTYLNAVELVRQTEPEITIKDFKIKIPFYLKTPGLEEKVGLYKIYQLYNYFRNKKKRFIAAIRKLYCMPLTPKLKDQ